MATQSKVMVTDYDFSTGEAIEREATAEELASFDVVNNDEMARREAEAAKAQSKAALLERLGITEDEAKLLLA
jgi:hypothetical protein